MPLLRLHSLNNPQELELVDSSDIASVDNSNGHAAIMLHGGVVKLVTETVEQIFEMTIGG